SWDAVWDGAARVGADGWTAELRIPLSQLRFHDPAAGDASATWGVNFARRIGRYDELSHWAPIPGDAPVFVSRFGELAGLDDLRPGRRIEIVPYTVARVTRAPRAAGDPFHDDT